MTSFRPRRPSAALVISVIALIVALGGTAYAGGLIGKNSVGSKQLKNGAVTTRKLHNRAVTAAKLNTKGLTVPNALHANSADSAGSAANATNATNAANAQPAAFAHVSSGGVLDSANSKNVGTVTQEATSFYCLSGIPFAVKGLVATVDYADSGTAVAQAGLGANSGLTGCPSNTQAYVWTADIKTQGAAIAGFFVQLYG